jgi:hypothetical protein
VTPAGGGAGPKSSSLLSESESGGFGGCSSSGAGGGAGPWTRAGFEACGGAGPTSLSTLLDRDRDLGGNEGPTGRRGEDAEGGGAGPITRRRLSLSGLEARSSSSSRLLFESCGGNVGPIVILCAICGVGVFEQGCRVEVTFLRAWTLTNGAAGAAIYELRHELDRRAILVKPRCRHSLPSSTSLYCRGRYPKLNPSSYHWPSPYPGTSIPYRHPSPRPPRQASIDIHGTPSRARKQDIAQASLAIKFVLEAMLCTTAS